MILKAMIRGRKIHPTTKPRLHHRAGALLCSIFFGGLLLIFYYPPGPVISGCPIVGIIDTTNINTTTCRGRMDKLSISNIYGPVGRTGSVTFKEHQIPRQQLFLGYSYPRLIHIEGYPGNWMPFSRNTYQMNPEESNPRGRYHPSDRAHPGTSGPFHNLLPLSLGGKPSSARPCTLLGNAGKWYPNSCPLKILFQ